MRLTPPFSNSNESIFFVVGFLYTRLTLSCLLKVFIYTVPYKKEILYNVLMDNYERIKVNNLICETLHPKNKVAKLYKRLENASTENYESIIKEFNNLNQSKRNRFKLKF